VYYRLWILVADRSQARLFQRNKPQDGIHLIQKLDHPEGRMKEREINSDRPGRAFHSADIQRSGYSPDLSATDQVGKSFAQSLAALLDQGRNQSRYERIVLVAAPRMLGWIRDSLSDLTQALVIESWDKDLSYLSEDQVIEYLEKGLKDIDSRVGLSKVI